MPSPPPAGPSPARRGPGAGCLVAAALALGLAGLVARSLFPASPGGAPASSGSAPAARDTPHDAAAEALLGLRAGSRIGGATVVQVDGFLDRQLPFVVEAGGVRFWVFVALKGTQRATPPVETERYALYHNAPASTPAGVVDTVLADVAKQLREREATVSPPSELGPTP
ncbi:MAG: hypothetical protein IT376_10945 [Polyangiaceae bacterium]|nr:hypothetical protein [Polyangiaceae bacterium]